MKDILKIVMFVGTFSVLFIPLIVANEMFFPYITGKNFWFRILVEISFASWVVLAILDASYRPRFSWILASVLSLVTVMLFANLLGENPQKSFWSNFERMDGYVTLLHFMAYFIILASILKDKTINVLGYHTTSWYMFLFTALIAASAVSFSVFKELAGVTDPTANWRIDGTLGNSTYMAVYMLFNTFIAVWLVAHIKNHFWKITFAFLAVLFVFLLFQTGTRGTIIGLAGGMFVTALYIAVFNTQYPIVRKYALGALVGVVMIVGVLVVAKDTALVQNSLMLQRATNINSTELDLRLTIWKLGIEGVKERLILGWGQENFSYVFNKYYVPNLSYRAELWYDRAHNVFMDWLVTGGVLGLLAYLSIFISAGYYLFWRPMFGKDGGFSVTERGLLLGIGAAYFIHNLVVFDNIVSYIFFAMVLALVHSRVSVPFGLWKDRVFNQTIVTQVVAPTVFIIAVAVVYMVNVPGIRAAQDIIDAFRTNDFSTRLVSFERAYDRNSFANQEITEQFVQQALNIANDPKTTAEEKATILQSAEAKLIKLAEAKPGDARVYVFMTSFYRSIGQIDKAREHAKLARQYSPNKPAVVVEQGVVEYQAGDYVAMNSFFKEAYDLETRNPEAREYYITSLFYNGDAMTAMALITEADAAFKLRLAKSDFVIGAINKAGEFTLLTELFELRVAADSSNAQNWATLAFLYLELKDKDKAIETLARAGTAVPTIAVMMQCISGNLVAGREPELGCQ